MTNKLVVIINSLKVPTIKKIVLYETKCLVPNYSCLQNPWLGGYRHQIPILSVLCPTEFVEASPEQNSWVRHWMEEIFLFSKTSIPALGSTEHRGSFQGAARCDVDHLPPWSAEVKKECSCITDPPIRFNGVERGNFTFNKCSVITQIHVQ